MILRTIPLGPRLSVLGHSEPGTEPTALVAPGRLSVLQVAFGPQLRCCGVHSLDPDGLCHRCGHEGGNTGKQAVCFDAYAPSR
jgi:hypothetical protein